jgi:predicted TIM-barrel fold metal-dependent hydrolase
MSKVIDLGLNIPLTVNEISDRLEMLFLKKDTSGAANYRRIFGPRWAEVLGMTLEKINAMREKLSGEEFITLLHSFAEKLAVSPNEVIGKLNNAGIEWGLVGWGDNEKTAELVSQWPDRFKGIAVVNPLEGMEAVRKLEHAVRELLLEAYYASPFEWGIRADNQSFYPLYAKAVELNIPVFIYTSMHYRTDLPMDIARPVYLDRVAMDFPDMRIVAECGGWPWVPEMIGVARRHQNVYINTCSNRPKYLSKTGSGWEMLMQFGNTLLQDQIVFASGAGDLGVSIETIVQEMEALPLKEAVKEKWMYTNALRLFNLE